MTTISSSRPSTLAAPTATFRSHPSPTHGSRDQPNAEGHLGQIPHQLPTVRYATPLIERESRPVHRLPRKVQRSGSQPSRTHGHRQAIEEEDEEFFEGGHRFRLNDYAQDGLDTSLADFESGYALEHSTVHGMKSSAAVPRSPVDPAADFRSPFDFGQQQAAFNAQHASSFGQRGLDHQGMQEGDDSIRSSSESDAVRRGFSFPSSSSGNTSAEEQEQNSIAAITRIGSLLERVSDLAQNARQSFLDGQHAQSSLCLGDLQKSLTEIGELGSRSLAQVNEPDSSTSSSQIMERTSSLGHRRNLTESAVKKRPLAVSTHDLDFSPFKTLRAQDGTPITNPAPPPSAPPLLYDTLGRSTVSQSVGPPIGAPVPPPSAPPFFTSSASSAMAAPAAAPTVLPPGSSQHEQQQQQQQQAMHQLFNTTPQQSTQSLNQSPVNAQTPFSFPFSSMSSTHAHPTMAHSTPSTPGPGQHSAHSSMNGSMVSDATGNTTSNSNSLQMVFQNSVPPSPQEKMNSLDGAMDAVPRRIAPNGRMRSTSGRLPSGASADLGAAQDDSQDGSLLSSERGMSGASVSPELKAQLDRLFFHFLEKVCSDVDYSDSKGEHLHQILTAKKMSRSSLATTSFKAFKFRIQAFTNAFHEEVQRAIGEEECHLKQTRAYLWTSNFIARFNESGVKEKSKGNHVWRVEARKNSEGRFEFREFKRKIIVPTQVAYHGLEWTWPLRIWDPQAPSTSIKAVFGAQNLPPWIRWKEGDHPVLYGTPDASCPSTQLVITAHYVARGHQQLVRLSATVDLQVAPLLDPPSTLPMADQMMTSMQDSEQTMEEMDLEQAESVIAPSQVAHVMSQINFPYTPPATFSANHQYFGNDGQTMSEGEQALDQVNIRQPLPSAPLPQQSGALQPHAQIQHNQIRDLMARQEQAAATMQLSMPPTRRRMTDHHSQEQARTIRAQVQQQTTQMEAQQQAMAQAAASAQQQHQQQQQHHHQQQQAAAAAAEMMMQQPASSLVNHPSHPGLTLTPMSSMPQMAATLPHMAAGSNDPMLSPALPIGFDPIAHEGARIAAMQQQQQQQHQQQQQSQQQQQIQHQQPPPPGQHTGQQSLLLAVDQAPASTSS